MFSVISEQNFDLKISERHSLVKDFHSNVNFHLKNSKEGVNSVNVLSEPFYILKDYDTFNKYYIDEDNFLNYPKSKEEFLPYNSEHIDLDRYNISFQKIKNAKLIRYQEKIMSQDKNIYENTCSFIGNYFIINTKELAYWHFMIEQFGVFIFFKKFIKNLQLLLLFPCKNEECCETYYGHTILDDFGYSDMVNAISAIYPNETHSLCTNKYSTIYIENLCFYNNIQNHSTNITDIFKIIYSKNLKPNVFTELSKLFDDYYLISKKINKIFIYNKIENHECLYYKNINHGVVECELRKLNEFSDIEIKNMLNDRFLLFENLNKIDKSKVNIYDDIWVRYVTPNEMEKIFDFFKNLGYSIINLNNFSFNDQIKMFRESTHIACYNGASTLCSVFAGRNTSITIVSLNKNYFFPHAYYAKAVQENVLEAMPSPINFSSTATEAMYTVEELFDYLNKNRMML
jgi:hypothetical protein